MHEPHVLIACPDLTADEERALLEHMDARADFLVIHNEERDWHPTAGLDPETAAAAWEAVRLVIDAGAATTGAVELIRWFRKRRGPSAPIDLVSEDGAIHRVPSDTGPDGPVQRLRAQAGIPYRTTPSWKSWRTRSRSAGPATRSQPPASARATGIAKHDWDFMTQDWKLSSAFDEPAVEDLRRAAVGGGVVEARTLALRLLEDPELVDEAITWLRSACAGDERALVAELASHDMLDRYEAERTDLEDAADLLRAELRRRDDDPYASVRLALARTLARLGRRDEALDALDALPEPPLANAQPAWASVTQREAWQLQHHAALERAQLLAATDPSAAERAYRHCRAPTTPRSSVRPPSDSAGS